jgi:hypothetical protein
MLKTKRSLIMQALFRVLMPVLLITGLALSATAVNAQQSGVQQLILQLLSGLNPQWAQIPGAPGVQYAPNANADLFRYENRYYYQHNDGSWYQGQDMSGPWHRVQNVPQSFHRIEAPYFRQPPGWAKGNKTGWKGDNLPPGQRKKYEGDQHGQMNKQKEGQHAYQRPYIRHEGGQQAYQRQNNKQDGGQHGQKDKHDGGQHGKKNKHDR